MYSYEDRIRAVKLYIKLGRRTGATIRQLGYPTRNALKNWHREFEQSQDLPAAYVRSWQKYSDEQKQMAVEHYLNKNRCIAGTLKALGYPCRETLAAWIDELHPETRIHVVGKAGGVLHSPPASQPRAHRITNSTLNRLVPPRVPRRTVFVDHVPVDGNRGLHVVIHLLDQRGGGA